LTLGCSESILAKGLELLHLENFRGFDDHSVPLRELTIVAGANNAGKSTIVEALRLVALVVQRFRRGSGAFVEIPDWLDHPEAFRGIQPAVAGRVNFEGHGPSTFHQYGDPPAVVRAVFSSGASVIVFVGPDGEIHGVARDHDGHAVGATAGMSPRSDRNSDSASGRTTSATGSTSHRGNSAARGGHIPRAAAFSQPALDVRGR